MISPLGIVAILVGVVILAGVVVILAGGTAWLVFRKKSKPPSARRADQPGREAVGSRPAQAVQASPPPSPVVEKPAPPGPLHQPVIEIVEKEQERLALERTGGAKSWPDLLSEAFTRSAQAGWSLPESSLPVASLAMEADQSHAQILGNTLNNTARDISNSLDGLAGSSESLWQAGWLVTPENVPALLDCQADLFRLWTSLVKADLVARLGQLEPQVIFDSPGLTGPSLSMSETAQGALQARDRVEMAYREVLQSLGNDRFTASQTALASGLETAKAALSGGSL